MSFRLRKLTGVYTWRHFKAVYLTKYGEGVRKHTIFYKLMGIFRK